MKRLIMLSMLSVAVVSHADNYPKILGVDGDKVLHFGVSAGLTGMLYLVMSAPSHMAEVREGRIPALIGSAGFALAIGLAKEVMDAGEMPKGKQYIDGGDMAANALGVAAMSAVIYFTDIDGYVDRDKRVQVGFDGRNMMVGLKHDWFK